MAGVQEEQAPLLPNSMEPQKETEAALYVGEKEVHNKDEEKESHAVVDGIPIDYSSPPRNAFGSGLLACIGSNDEFCSSDLEVCVLGTFAPCILHASNVERLYPAQESTFSNHCLSYTGLLCLGKFLFGCNVIAPCLSYPTRTELRRRFNLQGGAECFAKACGCCNGMIEGEEDRERCESACDFATHILCHRCALCQEGRELRRRLPHPGFIRSYMAMSAPAEQTMAYP